jgi:hypothetical protein
VVKSRKKKKLLNLVRSWVPRDKNRARSTEWVWPSRVRRHVPSPTAQMRTVASAEPVATT